MDTRPPNLTPGSVGAATGGGADVTFQWPPPALREEGTEPLQGDATLAAEAGSHASTQPAPGITSGVPDADDAPYLELQEALRKRQTDAERTGQSDHLAETRVERPELTPLQAAWLESHRYAVAPAPRVPIAQLLRQPPSAAARTADTNQPARTRLEPGPMHRSRPWLRSQLSWLRSRTSHAAYALRSLVTEPLRRRRTAAVRARHTKQPRGVQLERPGLIRRPSAWVESRMFWVAFALVTLIAAAEGIYILWPGSFRTTHPTVVAKAPVAPAPKLEAASKPESAAEKNVGTAGAALGGRLSIRSAPSGAEVSIDGRLYGKTPLTLLAVSPGERRIVLRLDGREVRQTVQVEPGGTASVIAPMSNATTSPSIPSGWIAIVSKADLDIFEGDVLVGSTRSPQVMMPAGVHKVRLVSEALGYEGTQQMRVEPGKVARINLTLPESTINLNALPWAEVLIDGKSVGETPVGNLPLGIGTHEITFRHPELGEKTVSTVVKANAPTRVTVDLRK